MTAAGAQAPGGTGSREHALGVALKRTAGKDELVWLEAGSDKFFALYQRPVRTAIKGAILLVPDAAEFIGQDGLLHSLRRIPTDGGWATLALQSPLLPATASLADYAAVAAASCARVAAALAYLQGQALRRIAIAAKGHGADRVLGCLQDAAPRELIAFAGIGSWSGDPEPLELPILDIVATRNPDAVRAADRRAAAVEAGAPAPYRRLDIDGADRSFIGAEIEVAKRLRGFLDHVPDRFASTR